nr:hypothetical protein [Candidatus Sigynarchaeota archaeon]
PDKRLPAPPQKETAPVVKTSPVITGHVVVQNKEIAVENGKLDLSSRSIKDIAEIAGFKDVKQLKHLKLGNNYLKDINGFGDLAGLEVLELQNNEIVEITGIERLVNLVRLNLNSNRLKDIAGLGVLARLEFLAIANNSISAVPRLPGLSHLKFLHIAGNPIDETMLERVGGVDKDGYARNPQKIIREGIAPVTARGASHVDAEGKKSTPEAPGSGNPDREDSWASEKKDRNWKLDKFDDM